MLDLDAHARVNVREVRRASGVNMWFVATGPADANPTTPTSLPVAVIQARARARVYGRGEVWALDGARFVRVAVYGRAPSGVVPLPL